MSRCQRPLWIRLLCASASREGRDRLFRLTRGVCQEGTVRTYVSNLWIVVERILWESKVLLTTVRSFPCSRNTFRRGSDTQGVCLRQLRWPTCIGHVSRHGGTCVRKDTTGPLGSLTSPLPTSVSPRLNVPGEESRVSVDPSFGGSRFLSLCVATGSGSFLSRVQDPTRILRGPWRAYRRHGGRRRGVVTSILRELEDSRSPRGQESRRDASGKERGGSPKVRGEDLNRLY